MRLESRHQPSTTNGTHSRLRAGCAMARPLATSRKTSAWQALLWLVPIALVVRMTVFIRRRSAGEAFDTVDSFALVQIVIVGLSLLALLAVVRTRSSLKVLAGTAAGALLSYYALCAVSALWSPKLVYSAYRAVEVITQFLLIYVAVSYCRNFPAAERTVLLCSALVVLLEHVARIRLSGVAVSEVPAYSIAAPMIFCYCVGEFFQAARGRRRMLLLCGVLSFVAVAMGICATSIIATICGFVTAAMCHRTRLRPLLGLLLLAIVVIYLSGAFDTFEDMAFGIVFPGKSQGTVAGLHGRLNIWSICLDEIMESPVFGHGFVVTTRVLGVGNGAHNALVQVALDTGLIGIGLFLYGVLRLIREAVLALRMAAPGSVGCLAAFAAASVQSMATPFVAGSWGAPTFVFTAILAFFTLYVFPGRSPLARASDM